MSDENPDDNAHIRALLAELGSGPDGEPMPPEVAARLDDTLARLVAERGAERPTESAGAEQDHPVVPLRRRWLPRITAAAAAVIVVGAGGVAVTNLGLFGDNHNPNHALSRSESQSDTAAGGSTFGAASALPAVASGSFAADVATLLHSKTRSLSTPEQGLARDDGLDTAGKAAARSPISASCPGPATTDGTPSLVRYDGRLAVVVVHPERAGRRLVEAWTCPGTTRLAATTLTP